MSYEIHLAERFERRVKRLTEDYKDDFVTPLRVIVLILKSNPHYGILASGKDNLGVVLFETKIRHDPYKLFYTFDGKVIKLRSVSGRG